MNSQNIWKVTTLILVLCVIVMAVLLVKPQEPVREYVYENVDDSQEQEENISPYAGEEQRGIKSLSQTDIESLQDGTGVAFGGMAKLAELNGYPGPRHVLDLAEEVQLTDEQTEQIEAIFDDMNAEAVGLGEQIIEVEQRMNDGFVEETITKEGLAEALEASTDLYADLRYVHLAAHFDMLDILTVEQVTVYNELRGYTTGEDICDSVPEGHDPDMWKLHNNCE